jgi:hypothetical protein
MGPFIEFNFECNEKEFRIALNDATAVIAAFPSAAFPLAGDLL